MPSPTGVLFADPRVKPLSTAGLQQAGCYLCFFLTGTTSPQNVYADGLLSTPLSQPTPGSVNPTGGTVADSAGRFVAIYLNPSLTYRVQMYSAVGVLLEDTDPYVVPTSNAGLLVSLTASVLGGVLYPVTAAETATSLAINTAYPYGDIRRYGIVPNDQSKATNNTTFLTALCSPLSQGPTGDFYFPSITGADTYYFNSQVDIRNGMHFDLCENTLNFAKAMSSATGSPDKFRGFLNVLTDVVIENGTIQIAVTGTNVLNGGVAIRVGSRSGYPFGQWSGGVYDQDDLVANGLPLMGDITLRNLYISSNNDSSNAQSMVMAFGGLRNCRFEHLHFDGQGIVPSGILYEFGFASQNSAPSDETQWTSSHACNMHFIDIHCQHLNTSVTEGYGLEIGGAHHCVVDGLIVDHAYGCINYYPGESMFWRPWTPTDLEGAKKGIKINGVVGSNLVGLGMSLGGATSQFGGYLATVAIPDTAKLDLMSFEVTNFSMDAIGAGIAVSGPCDIRNGRLDGTESSSQILLYDDCVRFNIQGVECVNGAQYGIRGGAQSQVLQAATVTAGTASIAALKNGMYAGEPFYFSGTGLGLVTGITLGQIYYVSATGLTSSAFEFSATPGGSVITPGGSGTASLNVSPARLKMGTVSNCLLAGNAGGIGAIWSTNSSVLMNNNRIGYNIQVDGVAETNQTIGVDISYTSNGGTVICDGNYVSTNSGTAYSSSGSPLFGVGNIRNPKNENSVTGVWEINGVAQVTAYSGDDGPRFQLMPGQYSG
jgi:hypothetical protein